MNKKFAFTNLLVLVGIVSSFVTANSGSSSNKVDYVNDEKVTTASDSYSEDHSYHTNFYLEDHTYYANKEYADFRVTNRSVNSNETLEFYVGDYIWLGVSGGTVMKYIYEQSYNILYGFQEYYLEEYGLHWSKYWLSEYDTDSNDSNKNYVWGYDGYLTKVGSFKLNFCVVGNVNYGYQAKSTGLTINVKARTVGSLFPSGSTYYGNYKIQSEPTFTYYKNYVNYTETESGSPKDVSPNFIRTENASCNGITQASWSGRFTVTYTLNNDLTYADGNKTCKLNWYLEPQKIQYEPAIDIGTVPWTGNLYKANLVYANEDEKKKWGTDPDDRSGTVTEASEAGNYKIYVYPTRNYCWKDGSTGARIFSWAITKKDVKRPIQRQNISRVYNGEKVDDWTEYLPDLDEECVQLKFISKYDKKELSEEPVNAGSYIIKCVLRNRQSYRWINKTSWDPYYEYEDIEIGYTIERKEVPAPTLLNPIVDYTGTPFVPNWGGTFDDRYMYIGDDFIGETDVGDYYIHVRIKNNNYRFAGNRSYYDCEYISYSILALEYTIPTFPYNSYDFDGTITKPTLNNFNDKVMDESEPYYDEATGKWLIKVSLKYPNKHCWNDKTKSDKYLEYPLKIAKVTRPTIVRSEFFYTGKTQTPEVQDFDSKYMEYVGEKNRATPGLESLTIRLKNKFASTWADGSTEDITFDFVINKKTVTEVFLEQYEYAYTGSKITPVLSDYDENDVIIYSPIIVKPATYKLIVSLRDKEYSTWSDGTVEDRELTLYVTTNGVSSKSNENESENSDSKTKALTASSGLPLGVTISIIIGSLFLGFLIFLIILLIRKKKRERDEENLVR